MTLPVRSTQLKQNFYHMFNLAAINIQMEDEVEYYFEVWDNDGVSGSKSTRSQIQLYKAPNKEELKEQAENNSRQLKDEMKEALTSAVRASCQVSHFSANFRPRQRSEIPPPDSGSRNLIS